MAQFPPQENVLALWSVVVTSFSARLGMLGNFLDTPAPSSADRRPDMTATESA
jgi:hypothetical protein